MSKLVTFWTTLSGDCSVFFKCEAADPSPEAALLLDFLPLFDIFLEQYLRREGKWKMNLILMRRQCKRYIEKKSETIYFFPGVLVWPLVEPEIYCLDSSDHPSFGLHPQRYLIEYFSSRAGWMIIWGCKADKNETHLFLVWVELEDAKYFRR